MVRPTNDLLHQPYSNGKSKGTAAQSERPSCLAVVVQAVQQHPAPGVANGQVPAVWAKGRAVNVVQRRLGCGPVAEDSHGGNVDHPAEQIESRIVFKSTGGRWPARLQHARHACHAFQSRRSTHLSASRFSLEAMTIIWPSWLNDSVSMAVLRFRIVFKGLPTAGTHDNQQVSGRLRTWHRRTQTAVYAPTSR